MDDDGYVDLDDVSDDDVPTEGSDTQFKAKKRKFSSSLEEQDNDDKRKKKKLVHSSDAQAIDAKIGSSEQDSLDPSWGTFNVILTS